jgi:hypothetical protein
VHVKRGRSKERMADGEWHVIGGEQR